MKVIQGLLCGLVLTLFLSNSWALITKNDVTIVEDDLKTIGIRDIVKIESDLGLENDKQEMVIRHVLTTGKNQASKEYMFVDINTLEQIKPSFKAFYVTNSNKQLALSNQQVGSLIHSMDTSSGNVPRWVSDKHQKKYINVVLQKNNDPEGHISMLSVKDAKMLINWAIKNNHLVREDHPATSMQSAG
ncbi:MAG: hypothetical protein EPO11_03625 [Gammaproteobacteria bacterium]|nr:MAG: hypothetical protein EPO11_03625 [Gammaproteobacteria bacterium]